MAKATQRMVTYEKCIEVTEPETTLTLSKDEAETLSMILGRVGGDPVKSRRRDSEAISVALRAAGAAAKGWTDSDHGISDTQRAIYFVREEY